MRDSPRSPNTSSIDRGMRYGGNSAARAGCRPAGHHAQHVVAATSRVPPLETRRSSLTFHLGDMSETRAKIEDVGASDPVVLGSLRGNGCAPLGHGNARGSGAAAFASPRSDDRRAAGDRRNLEKGAEGGARRRTSPGAGTSLVATASARRGLKKFPSRPPDGRPSTSHNIVASAVSVGVRGAVSIASAASRGAGSGGRPSDLPLGRRIAFGATKNDGAMYSGRRPRDTRGLYGQRAERRARSGCSHRRATHGRPASAAGGRVGRPASRVTNRRRAVVTVIGRPAHLGFVARSAQLVMRSGSIARSSGARRPRGRPSRLIGRSSE